MRCLLSTQKRGFCTTKKQSLTQAQTLYSTYTTGSPYLPLKKFLSENNYESLPTISDAYQVQNEFSSLIEQKEKRIGYKIGVTSKAIQDLWGVNEPVCGPMYSIFDTSIIKNKPKGLSIGVESEFILEISQDISTDITLEDAYNIVSKLYFGYEIIESRLNGTNREIDHSNNDDKKYFDLFKMPLQYTIADLCWGGGVIFDSKNYVSEMNWKSFDEEVLRECQVNLYVDDVWKAKGYGKDVLGSPFNVVVWLNKWLRQNDENGRGLRKGDLLSTGSVTGAVFLEKNQTTKSVFKDLGEVEFTFV